MYYLCKFFASWSLHDTSNSATRLLEKNAIEALRAMFTLLISVDGTLQTFQLASISYNKLQQLTANSSSKTSKKSSDPLYFICKVFDTWSLYDSTKSSTRVLDKQELDSIKNIFPKIMSDESTPLQAFQFTTISYNKLLQVGLETPAKPPVKKATEPATKVA